jgi:hypothetical protein
LLVDIVRRSAKRYSTPRPSASLGGARSHENEHRTLVEIRIRADAVTGVFEHEFRSNVFCSALHDTAQIYTHNPTRCKYGCGPTFTRSHAPLASVVPERTCAQEDEQENMRTYALDERAQHRVLAPRHDVNAVAYQPSQVTCSSRFACGCVHTSDGADDERGREALRCGVRHRRGEE